MRRSIKIAITLALLAGFSASLPFYFGVMTQRYSIQFLNNENNTLGKVLGVRLSFAEYKRGWFHSRAILQIDRKNSVGDWVLLKQLPIMIDHGPAFNTADHKVVGFGMVSINNIPLFENAAYKLNFREVIRFNGERGTLILVDTPHQGAQDAFGAQSLMMTVNSNLKADNFAFTVVGKGLYFTDPAQSLSANVAGLGLTLNARYIDERHWKMIAGFALNDDTIATLLGNDAASRVAVHADMLSVEQLHFDTQQIGKLLGEVVKIKQASDAQQPISPSSWMALFQQLLVQVVQNDTAVVVQGLAAKTPMGELDLHYNIAFPTLPQSHDYFDIATRGVGQFNVVVPRWSYVFPVQNKQFSLSDLKYSEKNNTVFSRESELSFGAFDVMDAVAQQSQPPQFYATGFDYLSDLQGNNQDLSQLMNWKLSKLCWSGQCFHDVSGGLKLMHMNFGAFRGIASATQQIVQYDPAQPGSIGARWMDLSGAYAQLISRQTEVVLTHDMQTAGGPVSLKADVTWPGLTVGAAPNANVSGSALAPVLDQSVYQLHFVFPASYLDVFLNQMASRAKPTAITPVAASGAKPTDTAFDVQAAEFLQYAIKQGYLKKVGAAYQSDWSGKGSALSINGVAWKSPS